MKKSFLLSCLLAGTERDRKEKKREERQRKEMENENNFEINSFFVY